MRILLIKTSSMGDILHTLPALTDAMQAIKNFRVDWVVEEAFAEIPGWHPAVEHVLPIAIRRWRKNWFAYETRQEIKNFHTALSVQNYDYVIDAQGLLKSALVARCASGVKLGFDFKSARESFASFFYNRCHFVDKNQHAVTRIRELFAKSLDYPFPFSPGDFSIANHFSSALPEKHEEYVIFAHATTRADKHWPETYWRNLIAQLKPSGLRIKLPWGTFEEKARAKRLALGYEYVDVLPFLSLTELAKIFMHARALVCVDTGLSHLAAALDRPGITLYGPTDPRLIGGYGQHQIALSARQGKLSRLEVSEVITSLNKIINGI